MLYLPGDTEQVNDDRKEVGLSCLLRIQRSVRSTGNLLLFCVSPLCFNNPNTTFSSNLRSETKIKEKRFYS